MEKLPNPLLRGKNVGRRSDFMDRIVILFLLFMSCPSIRSEESSPLTRRRMIRGLEAEEANVSNSTNSKNLEEKTDLSSTSSKSDTTSKESSSKKSCSDAVDCENCQTIGLNYHKVESGKTCQWMTDDETLKCIAVELEKAVGRIQEMCDAKAPSKNTPNNSQPEEASKTVAQTNAVPSKTTAGAEETEQSKQQPPSTLAQKSEKSAQEETKSAKEEGTESSEAETKPANNDETNSSTTKSTKPSEDDSETGTTESPEEGATPTKVAIGDDEKDDVSLFSFVEDFGPREWGGIGLAVVILVLLVPRCCCGGKNEAPRPNVPTKSAPPRGSLNGNGPKYTGVSSVEPVDQDSADDWGWEEDDNAGWDDAKDKKSKNRGGGDLEMSKVGLPLQEGSQHQSTTPKAGLSLPPQGGSQHQPQSRHVLKKSPSAEKRDVFSEMGLTPTKFTQQPSTGPKRLGAAKLPKGSADDWGADDDLDDLLND